MEQLLAHSKHFVFGIIMCKKACSWSTLLPALCIDGSFSSKQSHLECHLRGNIHLSAFVIHHPVSCEYPVSFKALIAFWIISAFVFYVSTVLLPLYCNLCKGESHVCFFKLWCVQYWACSWYGGVIVFLFFLDTECLSLSSPLHLENCSGQWQIWHLIAVWDPPGLSPMLWKILK